MIDKLAGLPTQIRQLEKRLKEMDASKVKPALVKEITDTIKNLKDMLKEKMDKKEQRKKDKAVPQEVEKEAISVPNAADVGAVAPNTVTTPAPGAPAATPIVPDDQKVNCPLCGGLTFNDNAALQQHMEFTHASDIAPTTPGQKLDKTVAAVDPNTVKKVETDPKLAPGVIVPDSVKKHDDIVDRVEKDPKIAPHIISEQETGPQFKLDDIVKPIRGAESTGKVMRWDGKPSDLVYVAWDSGPLADRDTFGGYYPHDLELFQEEQEPVEAAMPVEKPICNDCVSNKQKQGDLKDNYEALLKDLKDERKAHYAQGNHSWTARLDQKIVDLEKAIGEKFGNDKEAIGQQKFPSGHCSDCGYWTPGVLSHCTNCGLDNPVKSEKKAAGGPELIRQINKATSGHGYDSTVYSLTNGRFQQNVPLKINDTTVRMKQPENGTFEVKYPGMEWRPVLQPEFDQWLAEWKQLNEKNHQVEGGSNVERKCDKCKHSDYKHGDSGCMTCGRCQRTEQQIKRQKSNNEKESGAQNAEELTIMDHTPPRANTTMDEGGKDTHDEFQDEWAMPVTSAQKITVFNKELMATPITDQKTFGGYDISQDGKKLFNIKAKANAPMNIKQLEFCAQIELTRGLKQAKLVEKIAFLKAGSRVYITAEDKVGRRVKFASLDHGLRGWVPASKVKIIALESQPINHNGHSDNVLGQTRTQTLLDCVEAGPTWVTSTELLDANRPPATPESLNDLESAKECADCHGHFEGAEGETCPTCGRFAIQKTALETALPQAILPQRGDVNETDIDTVNTAVQQKSMELFKQPWDALNPQQQEMVNKALGITASLNKKATVTHREDGWHVLSEKGKNLGGPYKSKQEAVKRLRQVEYFKHHGSLKPFSKKAEVMADPYANLTTHITEMRGRMDAVQERMQVMPAVKTAEEGVPEMDLAALFADLTQGIELLETKLGGDSTDPEVHMGIEELENKLWELEEKLGLTPELSEHEKAEPEHKEIVEDLEKKADWREWTTKHCKKCERILPEGDGVSMNGKTYCFNHVPSEKALAKKKADTVTDETITTTNDPNAIPPATPATPAPVIQNVQPTDQDNLEVPITKPTSPPAPGQIWVFNSDPAVMAYVSMPDGSNPGKTI